MPFRCCIIRLFFFPEIGWTHFLCALLSICGKCHAKQY
uniref:Uncharacterized protein n=1 Tax=Arundo donax TaxID=35708 RepID=A0A0A8YC68_ARUDO